jgi:hypothetical protein
LARASVVAMALNVLLVAGCLSMLWDGLKSKNRPGAA